MEKSNAETKDKKYGKLSKIFQGNKVYVKTEELRQRGFHQRDIRTILAGGQLVKIKNGLFRYSSGPVISNQGFADLSLSVPQGVICLLSALSYYELTTFTPPVISAAISRGSWKPKIIYPPVEFYFFSGKQFEAGIDIVKIAGIDVRIYCPEKTICDCFRYRGKLGLDTAKEGLNEYLKKKDRNLEKLLEYADICRVRRLVKTWLDAIL